VNESECKKLVEYEKNHTFYLAPAFEEDTQEKLWPVIEEEKRWVPSENLAKTNEAKKEPIDVAIIFPGVNLSAGAPEKYVVGGLEAVTFLSDGSVIAYSYAGEGNSKGAGGSGTIYIGIILNADTPDDYLGLSSSIAATLATPEGGVTITYFWSSGQEPFSKGNVQGFTLGYSIGAQGAVSWAESFYK
jgi:hypothetical protein